MAMMKCEECGNDVSTKAKNCQKCGAPAPTEKDYDDLQLRLKEAEAHKEAEEAAHLKIRKIAAIEAVAVKNKKKRNFWVILVCAVLFIIFINSREDTKSQTKVARQQPDIQQPESDVVKRGRKFIEEAEKRGQKGAKEPSAVTYSKFNDEQICKAGISTLNGRDVKTIRVLSNKKDVIQVAYERLADGKVFRYSCKISGNEIKHYDGIRWAKNNQIFYSVSNDGLQLNIWLTLLGEKYETKLFKKTNFN